MIPRRLEEFFPHHFFLCELYTEYFEALTSYFKGTLISPLQHTRFQYLHLLIYLCSCHRVRQKRLDTVFKHCLFRKKFFPLNCPSTLVENKLNMGPKISLFCWNFYSTHLYLCFIESIPAFDYPSFAVKFEVR